MVNMKKILAVAAGLGAAVMLAGCAITFGSSVHYSDSEKYTAGNREITDKIEALDIDYMSGEVTLKAVDGNVLSVEETARKELYTEQEVHTWVDGSTLRVRYCAAGNGIDLNNLDKRLTIEIPSDWKLGDVTIDITSGDVTCRDIETADFNCSASSGDMDIEVSADTIRMDATSGDLNLIQKGESKDISIEVSSGTVRGDIEKAGTVNVSATSGNIDIECESVNSFRSDVSSGTEKYTFEKMPESIESDATSGDLTFYIPSNSDVTLRVDQTSGDLHYDMSFSKDGEKYVAGNGTNRMDISTSSGDIYIKSLN